MSVPKISIIIPCYKVEKYLDRCVESVVNQTFRDIEIILVDDASPDRVPELCDEWSRKDSRVKVIHKAVNEGLGYARNTGLDVANGEYVAFVDSDDYVDLRMYDTLYSATQNGLIDVVYCGLRQEVKTNQFKFIHDYDSPMKFNADKAKLVSISFIGKTEITNRKLFMSVWHGIYRREVIERKKIRFYSERNILSEDLPFQVEFCSIAQTIQFIPDILYTYCLNTDSLSRSFNIKKIDAAISLRRLLLRLVDNSISARYLIDVEFYYRIRRLLTQLILAANYSLNEKYWRFRDLCDDNLWTKLYIQPLLKRTSWKNMEPYRLLRADRPIALMIFMLFDNYVNRQTFSLKRMK